MDLCEKCGCKITPGLGHVCSTQGIINVLIQKQNAELLRVLKMTDAERQAYLESLTIGKPLE